MTITIDGGVIYAAVVLAVFLLGVLFTRRLPNE